jgi:hypothetical protein
MARNAAVVFVSRKPPRDITSYITSTKISVEIAMAAQTNISLSATADEVLDVRLFTLESPEGSVAISAITRTTRDCLYKRFSRCSLCRSDRALYCYFETECSAAPLIRAGNYLHSLLQMKASVGS